MSDLLYPGNPKRREDVIRKSQELQDLMSRNFSATNQLIDVLKKHLGLSFSHITVDEKASVKTNCEVIINRIHEIQAKVEEIDKKLKDKLEPTLYEKLTHASLSEYEHSLVATAVDAACLIAGSGTFLVVRLLMRNEAFLTAMRASFGAFATGPFALLAIGVIFLGIDVIIEAILGAIERSQLEEALKNYEEALTAFKPASESFQHSIYYVIARLDAMNEN